ncbi:sensor histidine kinase [Spirochaetia bacterium]|nr:sensor histidine kinase [Spirochaetia bacterium]
MISLKSRLCVTYTLFISVALLALTLCINRFTILNFASLVRHNIEERSSDIVRTLTNLYNPLMNGFDTLAIESMGMYFVHEGYIVTLHDIQGEIVWDARACDMQECVSMINTITVRMESALSLKGGMQRQSYPVLWQGKPVAHISIETYGPYFYSETELHYLSSINRLLLAAGALFILLTVSISAALSISISRPIVKAEAAARTIACAHSAAIRIATNYKTTELHSLSTSINELAAELEEGERRQRQLSSDIAHELRTPLTCLQGTIEAMLDGVWQPTVERLANCHEEIVRLGTLVSDLHLLTNLEWENIDLDKTEFDLALLLAAIADSFIPAAAAKELALHYTPVEPVIVSADYNRLKQVFFNLLSNAVKYTDSGAITIRVRSIEGRSVTAIEDAGIGIAAEELPHIFERFYRADKSRSRDSGGKGLGLAISAAIVHAHGGSITAQSTNGKGCVFTVHL